MATRRAPAKPKRPQTKRAPAPASTSAESLSAEAFFDRAWQQVGEEPQLRRELLAATVSKGLPAARYVLANLSHRSPVDVLAEARTLAASQPTPALLEGLATLAPEHLDAPLRLQAHLHWAALFRAHGRPEDATRAAAAALGELALRPPAEQVAWLLTFVGDGHDVSARVVAAAADLGHLRDPLLQALVDTGQGATVVQVARAVPLPDFVLDGLTERLVKKGDLPHARALSALLPDDALVWRPTLLASAGDFPRLLQIARAQTGYARFLGLATAAIAGEPVAQETEEAARAAEADLGFRGRVILARVLAVHGRPGGERWLDEAFARFEQLPSGERVMEQNGALEHFAALGPAVLRRLLVLSGYPNAVRALLGEPPVPEPIDDVYQVNQWLANPIAATADEVVAVVTRAIAAHAERESAANHVLFRLTAIRVLGKAGALDAARAEVARKKLPAGRLPEAHHSLGSAFAGAQRFAEAAQLLETAPARPWVAACRAAAAL